MVLIIAEVAFGCWYVWQRNRNVGVNSDNRQASQSQETDTQEQMQEEVTYTYPEDKWYEYKNENLGFTFKYPKDWSEIDVRFDREDFYLAVFNNPTGPWGNHNGVYQQADIELRGHSAAVNGQSTHGEYAKGFYNKDGKYFKVGDEFGDTELKDDQVLFTYDEGGISTLLIKRLNYGGYEGLELLVNIKNREVIGLNLQFLHPTKVDEYKWPAYSQSDVEIMQQVAASFRAL